MNNIVFWTTNNEGISTGGSTSKVLPVWLLILLAVLIFALITVVSYFILLHFDKKKHPENYQNNKDIQIEKKDN